ncbi:MAG: YbaB/EbfC family nucleoid-associated protein [Rhodobacterales bacterium]|nr:YbaB/EbfC family nucleoid-associated protein [Rhodobacterales bacterium]
MKNLGNLMKQAQQMQQKMADMQAELERLEITGSAGAGMVRVVLNGKSEAQSVKIDPALMADGDAEVLEDLILAAFNDAKGKLQAVVAEKMSEVTGGLPLPPGFSLPI